MKLLLAFKSFLLRRLIVEIGSENWFAAGCLIRQRKLHRCWCHSFIAQRTTRQRILIRCRKFSFDSETEFRYTRHKSTANIDLIWLRNDRIGCRRFGCGSETEFRCATHKSAANIDSLQEVRFRQRNRISLRNT
ncbi:hypothetical protein D5086_027202 [Populus alba]|uniref:Uncharacterized protein n=1 Tax=Populus alba TaxID=43335 RepID=A0ACC4B3W3_POPAL